MFVSNFDALLATGLERQQAGNLLEAEWYFRHILEQEPTHAHARFCLGQLAHQTCRDDEALTLMRQAWEDAPNQVAYLIAWGQLGMKRLGLEAVIAAFSAAADRFPAIALLHERLASLQHLKGRGAEALTAYERALEADPNFAAAHAGRGLLLWQRGQPADAMLELERAIALAPDLAATHANLGKVLLQEGDAQRALVAYRRAVALASAWGDAHAGLVEALVRAGDPVGAVQAAETALARAGYDSGVVAYQVYALRALGNDEAADRLFAFERFSREQPLPPPDGFADATALNAALVADLLQNPTLAWEPLGRTTRGGRQSTNLLERPTPVLAAFGVALNRELCTYIESLPEDSSHPFSRCRPRPNPRRFYGIDIWATILDAGGHQQPHIHSSGWLSGVYYVQVPDNIGPDDPAGWIEFGRPPASLTLPGEVPVITRQPRAGQLLLFPSYVFHRTLPFQDDRQRISIAFDVIL